MTLNAGLTREFNLLLASSNHLYSNFDLSNVLPTITSLRINSNSLLGSENDGPVFLSPFPNLTHLEIEKIEAGRVMHLSKLRSVLNHLMLISCVQSLDEVLIECGGDECVDGFLWSELHTLVVTGSAGPLELGSALQMIPWLKNLYLSRNSLTDNSLTSLTTLLTLNRLALNFNHLCRIPSLAPSARSSLKVLHLRHNQLESLKGLEHLSALEELDVAYNCISTSAEVQSLSSLPQLVTLCLEFNPLSYSKGYRITVLQKVSSAVNKKKFKLDDQPLSSLEKDVIGTLAVLSSLQLEYYDSYAASDNQVVTDEISDSQTRLTMSAKRRKAGRMREAEILETEVQTNLSSDLPVATNTQEEEQQPAVVVQSQSLHEGEHLTTKQRLEELRRTFGQENWLHSQAGNQVRQLLGWEEENQESNRPLLTEEGLANVPLKVDDAQSIVESNDSIVNVSEKCEEEEVEHAIEVESIEVLKLDNLLYDDETELYVYLVQRHVEDVEWKRLLTLSPNYLCEKDALSGQTLASWKMSSLKSLDVLQRQDAVRFQLFFLPASQSYRQRVYTMEENDFTEFEGMVQTVLSSRPENEKLDVEDVQLRCIKCDHIFAKITAAVKLRSVSSVAFNQVKGQLEEYLVCPSCGSELIFPFEKLDDAAADVGIAVMRTESARNGRHEPFSTTTTDNLDDDMETTGGDSSTNSAVDSEEGSVEVIHDKMRDATVSNCQDALLKSSSMSSKHSTSSHSSKKTKSISTFDSTHKAAAPTFEYSYADFSQVDHRLRLFCEMSLLSHQNEEFLGLIKADLVAANLEAEQQPVLLVVTSQKLYFMRITVNQSEQPEKWLVQEASFPLQHLVCIMTIIGHQGLVLHLGKDQSTTQLYLLLLRDNRRTRNSLHFLLGALEKCGLSTLQSDLMGSQWLALERLVCGKSEEVVGEEAIEATEFQQLSVSGNKVFVLCVECQMEWKEPQPQSTDYPNVSLMVTYDRIALISGDPRWLLSRQVHFRTWGVALLSVQLIVNLVSLESFVNHPEKLRLYFVDEASNLQEQWTVSMATRDAVDQLIEAVRHPWEAMFSVELEINELDE